MKVTVNPETKPAILLLNGDASPPFPIYDRKQPKNYKENWKKGTTQIFIPFMRGFPILF
ncbi:MAG: hypothetical protein ACLQU2_32645 [Candidatus Binataceae bacterium]